MLERKIPKLNDIEHQRNANRKLKKAEHKAQKREAKRSAAIAKLGPKVVCKAINHYNKGGEMQASVNIRVNPRISQESGVWLADKLNNSIEDSGISGIKISTVTIGPADITGPQRIHARVERTMPEEPQIPLSENFVQIAEGS